MMRFKCVMRAVATAYFSAIAINASAALLTNGGFESGDFTGWSVQGYAYIESAATPVPPLEGNYSALIVAPDSQNFGCLYSPPYPASFCNWAQSQLLLPPQDPLGFPFPLGLAFKLGGSIGQTFVGHAGDVVSFDWLWMSQDGAFFDRGLIGLFGSTNYLSFLKDVPLGFGGFALGPLPPSVGFPADVVAPENPPLVPPGASSYYLPAAEQTGFFTGSGGNVTPNTFSFRLPASGVWTMLIGVGQTEDTELASALLVDNFQISVVPEPATLALLGIGLAALGFSRRKQ